ncbi:uncharacterized protein LOC118512769 [Anopheles stephensi]|uniref:uncharacterized protein LOC118512769 n=1 Tax=Anopheles stephensi TaxID=30069 RepID=UPI001658B056|nr:uncharacterized protein LOC118512769 [Anopheles stephensi]XP_035913578.1 uncharacterized protein LOC118512769 [Anopheles stephensi]
MSNESIKDFVYYEEWLETDSDTSTMSANSRTDTDIEKEGETGWQVGFPSVAPQCVFREISNIDGQPSSSSVHLTSNSRKRKAVQLCSVATNTETVDPYDQENVVRTLTGLTRSHARLATQVGELINAMKPRPDVRPSMEFDFAPIDSVEELQNLDTLLQDDSEYRAKLVHWLETQITRVDVDNRLHELIDLLFTKTFFATMNWTGISKKAGQTKIALGKFKLVVRLFVELGGNNALVLNSNYVEN